jgi:hypothetical protein
MRVLDNYAVPKPPQNKTLEIMVNDEGVPAIEITVKVLWWQIV